MTPIEDAVDRLRSYAFYDIADAIELQDIDKLFYVLESLDLHPWSYTMDDGKFMALLGDDGSVTISKLDQDFESMAEWVIRLDQDEELIDIDPQWFIAECLTGEHIVSMPSAY